MEYGVKTLSFAGKVVFEKVTMPQFGRISKNFIENEACFMLVNQGGFDVRTPSEHFNISPQKALLAKCFDYFFEGKMKEENGFNEAVGILLHKEVVEDLFDFSVEDNDYQNSFNATSIVVDQLLDNFKIGLELLIENPDMADEGIIATKLKEFVILISKKQNQTPIEFLSGMFRINVTPFQKTIENNLFSSLSLADFALLCGMSRASFKRQFKELYAVSPKQYIISKKIAKSKKLLRLPNSRISDVAYEIGYESVTTFNRNFKSEVGMSPTEYLSQNA